MSSDSSTDMFPIGVLSAKDGLMLFFTLPSVEPHEIEGMVRLQVEEISPYPIERTCFSWEKVWENASQCRVLVVLCDVAKLDFYRETSQNDVDRIDVDLLAYWEGILKSEGSEGPPKGFHLLLIDDDLYLVAADAKGLCMTWNLHQAQDITADDLEEDISLAATSINASISEVDSGDVTLWHGEDLPEWALTLSQNPGGRTFRLTPLPNMEEGLESRTWPGTKLDLMPQAWKDEKDFRAKQKKALTGVMLFLILWAVGMMAVMGRNLLLKQRLENLQAANAARSTDQVLRLTGQVDALRPFINRRTSALNSLLLIAKALPDNGSIVVDRFHYAKGDRIICGGEVKGGTTAFTTFLENLGTRENLNVLRYDLKDGSRAVTFQVDLEWLPTAPSPEEVL